MAKGIARYTVTFGLAGCYMPDSVYVSQATTRRDLIAWVEAEIAALDWPKSMRRQLKMSRIWRLIAKHGSSSIHFSLTREGYELAFHGMTDAEYRQAVEAEG